METRELRYFVAVADELHVGRAAQRLGMAQPPLSRAIQRLERRLGTSLLERTSRGVTLTAPGRVLADEARAALAAVEAAARRTRRAAARRPSLVLVTKAGATTELLAKLLDAYASEPEAVDVGVEICGPGEQGPMLRDGRADVALLHRPFDDVAGLDTEDLVTEGQVAVLPAGHPLTERTHLYTADVTDLPDLPMARFPNADGSYPDGPGPDASDATRLYQLIGLGRGVVILPESVRSQLRDDVAAVPIVDAAHVTTVIAWPPHIRSRLVADFVRAATRV